MLQSLKLPALEGAVTATLVVTEEPDPALAGKLPPVSTAMGLPEEFCKLHQVPTGLVPPVELTLLHFQFKVASPVLVITIFWAAGILPLVIPLKPKALGFKSIIGLGGTLTVTVVTSQTGPFVVAPT